jgi:hypothetical protein
LFDSAKKRIMDFEKLSDADKIKTLTEFRDIARKEYLNIQEMNTRIAGMTEGECLEVLKKEHGITPEEEEKMLRNMEHRPSEEGQREFRKKYKMGEFQVQGELSGFDLFLRQKGKEHLIGWVDRVMSNDPPKLPPPRDLNAVFKNKNEGGDKDKKPADAAAVPAAGGDKAAPAAGGKPGDKAAPAAAKPADKKPAKK